MGSPIQVQLFDRNGLPVCVAGKRIGKIVLRSIPLLGHFVFKDVVYRIEQGGPLEDGTYNAEYVGSNLTCHQD